MKHIKTFEDFEQQTYTVGDMIKLKNGETGQIVKLNSKNSYIINLMKDTQIVNKPIEIRIDQIEGMVKANNKPVDGADMNMNPSTNPSNDLVINGGYPDTPMANPMKY